MPHNLVVGISESGKSLVGKLVCSAIKSKGVLTGVLDPLLDPEWDCDFITDDPVEFLAWCKANKSAVLFVDEGGTAIGRYNTEMEWVVTTSRHWGHSAFILCQGATQLPPIVRDQCSKLILFAVGDKSLRCLSEDLREDLTKLPKLNPLEFFIVSKFAKRQRGLIKIPEKSGKNGGRAPLQSLEIVYNEDTEISSNKDTSHEIDENPGNVADSESVDDS